MFRRFLSSAVHSGSPRTLGEVSNFPGAKAPFTHDLSFLKGNDPLPVFRILSANGEVLNPAYDPKLTDEHAVKLMEGMVRLNTLDMILYNAQRQGRISFYMTNTGEEAVQFGSSTVLHPEDEIFAQYREAGVLLERGFSLQELMAQCFGSYKDNGKGRQMPVHYGSKKLHFQTISSPLGTQIPQAAGAGYAMKLLGKPNVVMCYFGDGAASEGDFHAALNFAATLECPTVFFCRNNGYAISTPTSDQYRGDGIVARGLGYGIHSVRVDGNDLLAVIACTKAARELAVEKKAPVLIEAMTYRGGHHSTSDDSTRYRSEAELNYWNREQNPIARFRHYLFGRKLWTEDREKELQLQVRKQVLAELDAAEKDPKPAIEQLFEDVYESMPWHLQEQKQEMLAHVRKYAKDYKLEEFAKNV
ncbi:mitochondrial branched-chain amino acid degradation 2-oxoisovalerate dehydrogenase alpha subunit [Andalucia godoyi]|uniref:2-oxoisovalerate dehydrogenase subunit alpha n=1 Tax=Andalucia godoyi TaxID=505711 RepID=A0A8K0F2E4_ANDGO|nr:mitochondrial branched-chain amino acid degradation 2-oxoisovalerate dehydrogenase alpha subunit [Andalucia godoyi]|eukprot:ANDGO_02683.mRNA.1 mitochondrial branched-chain amino acid degradation 2-oxoisovalerate dehydrogenase alpha subunit